MSIKFGPAGIGKTKEIPEFLKQFKSNGIKAVEIPFTYQVWIKDKKTAQDIKENAELAGVNLSIHAQYWINLNSPEKDKVENSKKRILKCCEVASWLDAKNVVFHCGYYGKMEKEEAYQKIKLSILEMQEVIKKNEWDVELCPEVMGKKNVFGSIEEISRLVEETNCGFCIDLAHVLARYGKYNMDLLKKYFPQKKWHCHFSGIDYGEKGEKKHILTPEKEIKKIISILPEDKDITVINESPSPIEDTLLSIKLNK